MKKATIVLAIFAFALATSLVSVSTAQPGNQAAAKHFHEIDFDGPYPKSIDIVLGDSIIFVAFFDRDPGLFDPSFLPDSETTDGKTGEVLNGDDGRVRRINKDKIQVMRFESRRTGEAKIFFRTITGRIMKETVIVTVK